MMAKKPEKVIELAVKGMLPKGPLRKTDVSQNFMYTLVQSTRMQLRSQKY